MAQNTFKFGQYVVDKGEIFFQSKYTYGIVNSMPVKPGHVLVLPKRVVTRYGLLSQAECQDLALSVQKIGRVVEAHWKASALSITCQDGSDAGQTVHHVHMHILPRHKGDFKNNDDIYDEIDKASMAIKEDQRKTRTLEEMKKEATILAKYFEQVF